MAIIYLVEIIAATDSGGTLQTLRYSSGGGYNHSSAAGFYEPRIIQAANINRDIIDNFQTFGSSKVGYGEIVISNVDGALDSLINYGYGKTAKILIGDDQANYSSFDTVLKGVVEQPEFDFEKVVFRFKDRQQELTKEIQPSKFSGTNSGPTGIEGTANDLKGQPKPRCWGVIKNIAPAPVNTSALIFGCNFTSAGATAPVNTIDAVYDGGNTLTYSGNNRANLAALQGATIAAGQYDTCTSEGLIRLGASPDRQITIDLTEGSTSADRQPGGLINRILLDAGVVSGDISSADVTALNTDAPYQMGIYVNAEADYRAVLDEIASSVGAWYAPDKTGLYRFAQFKEPSGSPAVVFKRFAYGVAAASSDADLISIERLASNDAGRGIPSFKVNFNYQKNYTPQTAGELAGAVTDARVAYLDREYRTISVSDSAILTQFPQSPDLNFDSLIINETNASDEATRRLNLYKVRRDLFLIKTKLSKEIAAIIDLGTIVKLEIARFGLGSGKLFVVIGVIYNAESEILELKLWG